uniref:Protein CHUP1, chloroplastic n=1 Tax=Kalanchoe fedtschenkoi TaxID=63787 RepID=A0A7N0U2R8_KALFE
MVAGKVKMAMGIQKSSPAGAPGKAQSTSKPGAIVNGYAQPPPPSTKTALARSFGVYFPRSSTQVQPRPPDVAELLRVMEELRERESQLKTELLELKLVRESAALVPVLEREVGKKESELESRGKEIESLRAENEFLRSELNDTKAKLEESQSRGRELLQTTSLREPRVSLPLTENMEGDELTASQRFEFQGLMDATVKSNLIKNLRKGTKQATTVEQLVSSAAPSDTSLASVKREETESEKSTEETVEICDLGTSNACRSRAPRVPKPPPKPSSSSSSVISEDDGVTASPGTMAENRQSAPPPPPPPPPLPTSTPFSKSAPPPPPPPTLNSQLRPKCTPPPPPPPLPPAPTSTLARPLAAKVRRVPEVVEFYHSLMRRDSRRDAAPAGAIEALASSCARDMIGEIENRSAYLLAVKTDVETQGDFIRFLINEVQNAAFSNIEDVGPFVKWLDDELSFLVDERAVLKHFDWPEQKADALREAAFGYSDLKKLEIEASSFQDDPTQAFPYALKKMQALYDKLEHGIYNLSRMRESATNRYKLHRIPMDWMLETGLASQIKLASVKLAMMYMQRVSAELEHVDAGPEEEELIVQGVRFAFRVHQFAGGFDAETMKAFSELREKARTCHQHQQEEQQRFICRSTGSASSSRSVGDSARELVD